MATHHATKMDLSSDMNDTQDYSARFLKASRKFAEYGNALGIRITPSSHPKMPLFRKLSVEDQASAVAKIEVSLEIFHSVIATGGNLRNPNTVAWFACQKFGYTPPSDFFGNIADDDIIQIYTVSGVHRFANLRFFEICSYTLEQLYSQPWHILWDRDPAETKYLLELASRVCEPAQRGTIESLSPNHRVVETSSPFKYETEYSMKYIAPLTNPKTHEKVGFIVSEGVKLLNPVMSTSQEEYLLTEFFDGVALSSASLP